MRWTRERGRGRGEVHHRQDSGSGTPTPLPMPMPMSTPTGMVAVRRAQTPHLSFFPPTWLLGNESIAGLSSRYHICSTARRRILQVGHIPGIFSRRQRHKARAGMSSQTQLHDSFPESMELSQAISRSQSVATHDFAGDETDTHRPQYALPSTDEGFQAWFTVFASFLSNGLIWGFALSFGVG